MFIYTPMKRHKLTLAQKILLIKYRNSGNNLLVRKLAEKYALSKT